MWRGSRRRRRPFERPMAPAPAAPPLHPKVLEGSLVMARLTEIFFGPFVSLFSGGTGDSPVVPVLRDFGRAADETERARAMLGRAGQVARASRPGCGRTGETPVSRMTHLSLRSFRIDGLPPMRPEYRPPTGKLPVPRRSVPIASS